MVDCENVPRGGEDTMKCMECTEIEMVESRENHRYQESGLPNVVLRDVLVRRCPRCGIHTVSIQRLTDLHRALALALIQRRERLTPIEVRFLRKSLGWSGADFARKFHVRPEQVSRWESGSRHVHMSISNELLLRLLVAQGQKIEDYAEQLDDVASEEPEIGLRLEFEQSPNGWALAS